MENMDIEVSINKEYAKGSYDLIEEDMRRACSIKAEFDASRNGEISIKGTKFSVMMSLTNMLIDLKETEVLDDSDLLRIVSMVEQYTERK